MVFRPKVDIKKGLSPGKWEMFGDQTPSNIVW